MAKGKYQKWLTPEGLTLLQGWARDGLTDEQIAHNMGISRKTLAQWKLKYSDISDTLKKGKEVVDLEVENALLKKAKGYNAKVHKTFKVKEVYYDDEGRRCEKEHLETGTDEVHVAADTPAQIFWLKNRRPDKWRNHPENVQANTQTEDDNFYKAVEEALKGKQQE